MNFNQIYHVYNHANAFEDLFKEDFCYGMFLNKLVEYVLPYADLLAFCLMPNHFHLVIRIRSEEEVKAAIEFNYNPAKRKDRIEVVKVKMKQLDANPSLFFSRRFSDFFNSYTKTINKCFKRRGSLFLKNFKRKEVDSEQYLKYLIYYVHINPVRHQILRSINEWPWSSYKSYFKEDFKMVETSYVLKHYGGIEPFMEQHLKPYRRPVDNSDDHDTEVGFLSNFTCF